MSAGGFFVPCTVCGKEPSCWRHDTDTPLWAQIADPEVARALSHGYQPDETSAEWAAVKMREALSDVQPYLRALLRTAEREAYRTRLRSNMKRWYKAMTLADAAGITNAEGT